MRRVLVAAVVALLALSGCSAKDVVKAPSADIDVATPDMVAMKAKSDIEPCPAPETKDGGLPAKTVRCLGGGRSVDLSTLKGPLVLNFWNSPCVECQKESPALAKFYRDYGRRIPVLGVDAVDGYPGIALRKAIGWGITYPIVADPLGDLQGTKLSVRGVPTFFFLHADGSLTAEAGGKKNEAQIVAMVEKQFGIQL
ncbi:TlpA family protein disulfide reductase [Nocardioides sp. DS6]|uniref:TlpA family protein disulfide reductase n=1 Tax=Nocardioides eburneus TaxID=3231482 RepID=A0ABV3SZC7_9ACTN